MRGFSFGGQTKIALAGPNLRPRSNRPRSKGPRSTAFLAALNPNTLAECIAFRFRCAPCFHGPNRKRVLGIGDRATDLLSDVTFDH